MSCEPESLDSPISSIFRRFHQWFPERGLGRFAGGAAVPGGRDGGGEIDRKRQGGDRSGVSKIGWIGILENMRSHSMSSGPSSNWSDKQLVEYVRHWAIERGNCGRDGYAADRINKLHVFPAGDILQNRGPGALAKLLPLLRDDNANVRLTAASLAYDFATPACRTVLEELIKTLDMSGVMAWTILSIKDPNGAPDPTEFWGTRG
jgi:hypothetical protein